jgi:hypothetical protein
MITAKDIALSENSGNITKDKRGRLVVVELLELLVIIKRG